MISRGVLRAFFDEIEKIALALQPAPTAPGLVAPAQLPFGAPTRVPTRQLPNLATVTKPQGVGGVRIGAATPGASRRLSRLATGPTQMVAPIRAVPAIRAVAGKAIRAAL